MSPALTGLLVDAATQIVIAALEERGTPEAAAAIAEVASLRIARATTAPERDWTAQPAREEGGA